MALLHHLLVLFWIDPRGLLSAATPAKTIGESISKCRRQLKAWVELGKQGPCKYRPAPTSVPDKYASQHGVAAAAQHLSRKLEEQGDMFNVFQHVKLSSVCSATKIKPNEKCNAQKNCNTSVVLVWLSKFSLVIL